MRGRKPTNADKIAAVLRMTQVRATLTEISRAVGVSRSTAWRIQQGLLTPQPQHAGAK